MDMTRVFAVTAATGLLTFGGSHLSLQGPYQQSPTPLRQRQTLPWDRNTIRLTSMSGQKISTASSPVFYPLLVAPRPSRASLP